MAPRVFLIDGSSYVYRAFFAVRNLATSKGLPTNAVFGFTNMLLKVLKAHKPEAVGVVFDAPGKTFRDEIFPAYKATRTIPDAICPAYPRKSESGRSTSCTGNR